MTSIRPSTEQSRIIASGLVPQRVSAGAGTGKTTTITMFVAEAVSRHGLEPEEVLGITFTNKAAADLAARIRQALVDEVELGREVEVHTYHGLAAQILREFGPLVGVERSVELITPTYGRQLMREAMMSQPRTHLDLTYGRSVEAPLALASRLGDHLLQPGDITVPDDGGEVWEKRRELLDVIAGYAEEKRRLGVLDFGDLVTGAHRVVTEHPEVAKTIRDRYRLVVLDEYQDTNPGQRLLFQTVFGRGFPVLAVGDVDQTIYEWRGATPDNFTSFPTHFPKPDGSPAEQSVLTLNRRSGRRILDVANAARALIGGETQTLQTEIDDAEVVAHWAGDAIREAEWLGARLVEHHEDGTDWRQMAVLFRKNKDIPVVLDALARHEIPVEVANVGGLLAVPEVADMRAWMKLLADPAHGPSALRLLTGSRFRLGFADLYPLTRLASASRGDEDVDELPGWSVVEALESAGHTEALPLEARSRLERFGTEYRVILEAGQGETLVELTRLILDVTGAWADIDALPPVPRMTARLNVHRFLDLTETWGPLRGRASLESFLEYLEAMEEESAEQLDAARLSGEDAVTLLTVHRAKGLEWEVVALPALAKDNFPSRSMGFPDPATKPEYLPHEVRLDADALPVTPRGEDKGFREILRRQHLAQEWRVAYVALTRAKRVLLGSGAFWYGTGEPLKTPKAPSELFELIAASATEVTYEDDPGRPVVLRHEPGPPDPDPHFEGGWQRLVAETITSPQAAAVAASRHGAEDQYHHELMELQKQLSLLPDLPPPVETPEEGASVTGLVTYAGCPKRYFWTAVDPLPRRHSEAARRGTDIHRRIELHHRGQVPFEEVHPEIYDTVEGEGGEGAWAAFAGSPYAQSAPALVEVPFLMDVAGMRVRGRIDAIYVNDDAWDIVDFKSGRRGADPARHVQLEAYAIAAQTVDLGLPPPASTSVTFVHLGGGLDIETRPVDDDYLTRARAHLQGLIEGIQGGEFEASPGPWCSNCDFLRFCDPGQAFLASS